MPADTHNSGLVFTGNYIRLPTIFLYRECFSAFSSFNFNATWCGTLGFVGVPVAFDSIIPVRFKSLSIDSFRFICTASSSVQSRLIPRNCLGIARSFTLKLPLIYDPNYLIVPSVSTYVMKSSTEYTVLPLGPDWRTQKVWLYVLSIRMIEGYRTAFCSKVVLHLWACIDYFVTLLFAVLLNRLQLRIQAALRVFPCLSTQ